MVPLPDECSDGRDRRPWFGRLRFDYPRLGADHLCATTVDHYGTCTDPLVQHRLHDRRTDPVHHRPRRHRRCRALQLVFHNSSSSTCTLYGYPGVSFLDSAGAQIGPPAERATSAPMKLITLVPGADAYSGLKVTDPGIPPCSGAGTVAHVRVCPPNDTSAGLVAPPSDAGVLVGQHRELYWHHHGACHEHLDELALRRAGFGGEVLAVRFSQV